MTRRFPLTLVVALLIGTASDADQPDPTDHWSWRPPERPAIPDHDIGPDARNPIDAFILDRLRDGPPLAPEARPEQLLRRLSFDLVGLPPTPDELERFLVNHDPDAWEQQVDRLLASPAHGERWGRHWLDLARYADTNGYEHDEVRPDAWKYRDYVIDSFNADKLYDRFVAEQLAGDELYPDSAEARIATGFNLLGPDMTDAATPQQRRQNTLNDMTDTAGLVFLGMTIGCAQCHDHKFEPIPTRDYYRLQAFFTPTEFRKDFTLATKSGTEPTTHILHRGELNQPGTKVGSGWPSVLAAESDSVEPTTRASLANWIRSRDNPISSRVIVNRLWQHHFGRGIVATSSDFGTRGEPPTHPELLDWLAVELPDRDWRLKELHRLMLTSATYRRASVPHPDAHAIDPENHLWTHMHRRRLEGEIIRDSLLAVGGHLNRHMGGPGVFPPLPSEIKAGGKGGWKPDPDPANRVRRSVYIFVRRAMRFPFLEVFDFPDSNLSCPEREQSTTASQSLAMLNATEVRASAEALARRIEAESNDPHKRITLAYRWTFGRSPSADEIALAEAFLRESPIKELCRALLNTNEFVYVD